MANSFYTHTGFPASNSKGASAGMRAEFDAIMAAFDLMPNPAGPGLRGFSGGQWANPAITNGSIDGTAIGAVAAAAAKFTTIGATGLATFPAGINFSGTLAGLNAPTIADFHFLRGDINNTPIGNTTPSSGVFTNLTATGTINLPGLTSSGTASFSGGVIELGNGVAQSPYIDFHASGGAANDYDARIIVSGGTAGTVSKGNMSFFANAFNFSARPTWAGVVPYDTGNLVGPLTTAGNYTVTGPEDHTAYLRLLQANALWFYAQNNSYAMSMRSDSAGFFGLLNGAQSAWNLLVYESGAVNFPRARPTWAGLVPWDNGNLTALSQLSNNMGFITAGATVANATAVAGNAFNFSGNGGQPIWVWGNNQDSNTMMWNPSNFSVNYANSAGYAGSAGSVGGTSDPASRSYTGSSVGAQVEIGPIQAPGTGALDAGAPYVMVGIRCDAWRGPSGDCVARLFSRLTQVQQR